MTHVWPSEANFLLTEFKEPERAVRSARRGGVLIRAFNEKAGLDSCMRITVGDSNQNDQLLASLRDDK